MDAGDRAPECGSLEEGIKRQLAVKKSSTKDDDDDD
jgi:hypothetical protein